MDMFQLQSHLRATGRYAGKVDGVYGPATRAALLLAMTDGPDTSLTEQDFVESSQRMGVSVAAIKAFRKVEAAGVAFAQGRPKILFEGHRFSKATKGIFDKRYPAISYPRWDRSKYPASQDDRYDQLLRAVALNVDAAFASASYGAFQILGENFKVCGFDSPFAFAEAQARDEEAQLMAFEGFIKNSGLLHLLRAVHKTPASWEPLVARYNGPAYRENNYHVRCAEAYVSFGGL